MKILIYTPVIKMNQLVIRRVFLTCAVILVCNAQTSSSKSQTSLESEDQTKNVGDNVELNCVTEDVESHSTVMWLFKREQQNSIHLSFNTLVCVADSRYSVKVNMSLYTLMIRDVQENDTGTYQCRVVSGNEQYEKFVKLTVVQAPKICSNSSSFISVSRDAPAVLECYGCGFKNTPTITWSRENNTEMQNGDSRFVGNVLEIESTNKNDRGTYYCIAEDDSSRSSFHEIKLEILFAPVVTMPQALVAQAMNYTAELKCHIEANPNPTVFWIKDGFSLLYDIDYIIDNVLLENQLTISTLRVLKVKDHDYGNYSCFAVNVLGRSEDMVKLFEVEGPICYSLCNALNESNEERAFEDLVDSENSSIYIKPPLTATLIYLSIIYFKLFHSS